MGLLRNQVHEVALLGIIRRLSLLDASSSLERKGTRTRDADQQRLGDAVSGHVKN